MNSADHQRASDLFVAARKLPASERPAFLERECGGDTALRAEVESLLGHDSEQSGFLATPALGQGFDLGGSGIPPKARPRAAMPKRIASYRIVDVLGEGGMGVVYLAEQDKPRRRVALKVLKAGATTPAMLRRFEFEAQILGRLQHAGIAQIYEAGVADEGSGRVAFFAMEYVRGRSILEHADAEHLDPRGRLRLIAQVCEAVQFAHLKGVIHRDLKPANILVDQSGQPRILDFGVARATDADVQATAVVTDMGQLIGTLPYMSPEQVAGDPSELDTRSDVYALGVIAYELLAGKPPHDLSKTSIHEALRMIREKEPTPLGSLERAFRGDIETIVGKALEKDKLRRYQSASDLGADILRYLDDEPIVARPASRMYQFRKFARRNKGLVGGAAATVVTLVIGVVVATTLALREADQRELAEKSAELARTNEEKAKAVSAYLRELFHTAMDPMVTGPEMSMSDVIDRAVDTIGTQFIDQPEIEADLRNEFGAIYYMLGLTERAEPQYVTALALRRLHLGDEHRDTLDSVNNLGQLRMRQGRLAEAEVLIREALSGRSGVLGADHAETLTARMHLGMVLEALDRAEEAEMVLRETLAAQLAALGEDHNGTLTTMANLSSLIRRRGAIVEAEQLIRRAYEGLKRVHGADHPTTLLALGGVAKILKDRKQYDQAEPLYREQVAGLGRAMGEDHPDTLIAAANLALLLRRMNKLDEAEAQYERAYRGFRHALGDESMTTLRVAEALVNLLRDRRKWTRAEFVMREVLQTRRRTLGRSNPTVLESTRRLIDVVKKQDKLDEAERMAAELVQLAAESLGDDDWRLARYQAEYGDILDRAGKHGLAEKSLRHALDRYAQTRGERDRRTVDAIRRLIRFYESRNKLGLVAQFTARLEHAKGDGDSDDP